mgnify:CR=1 FL=1
MTACPSCTKLGCCCNDSCDDQKNFCKDNCNAVDCNPTAFDKFWGVTGTGCENNKTDCLKGCNNAYDSCTSDTGQWYKQMFCTPVGQGDWRNVRIGGGGRRRRNRRADAASPQRWRALLFRVFVVVAWWSRKTKNKVEISLNWCYCERGLFPRGWS